MAVNISVQIDHDPILCINSEAIIINTTPEPSEDDYYHGETGTEDDYKVNPSFSDQVLPTRGKRMKEDLTISAVPYIAVDNGSGGRTVTIMG